MRGAAFALLLSLLAAPAVAQTESSPGVGPMGPKGDKGDDGAVGSVGPAGLPGRDGAAGPSGPQGPKGDTGATGPAGPAGPVGSTGATGSAGPRGETGAQGLVGATGAVGPAGPKGDKGDVGATGPVGPKAAIFVCNTTVAESFTLLGVSAGIRARDGVSCPGALTTDQLIPIPTNSTAMVNGYAVHHVFPTAANTLRVILQVPAITIGGSYSIPVAVYAVNR